MKRPPGTTDSENRDADPIATSAGTPQSTTKLAYVKPRVEEAGSVFSRTRALGPGTKDVLTGSILL